MKTSCTTLCAKCCGSVRRFWLKVLAFAILQLQIYLISFTLHSVYISSQSYINILICNMCNICVICIICIICTCIHLFICTGGRCWRWKLCLFVYIYRFNCGSLSSSLLRLSDKLSGPTNLKPSLEVLAMAWKEMSFYIILTFPGKFRVYRWFQLERWNP